MTTQTEIEDGVAVATRTKLQPPSYWQVILLNDNYTTMEFVVWVLVNIFDKNIEEANQLTIAIHTNGKGIAGIYPKQIAEEKFNEVCSTAKQAGHPLRCEVVRV